MSKHATLMAGAFAVMLVVAASADAGVYTVMNYADDGSRGTLRWAIEQSNANPGGNVIQIVHVGRPPYVIKLNSLLPAIRGADRDPRHAEAKGGRSPGRRGHAGGPAR